jgi:hypothetical protein
MSRQKNVPLKAAVTAPYVKVRPRSVIGATYVACVIGMKNIQGELKY